MAEATWHFPPCERGEESGRQKSYSLLTASKRAVQRPKTVKRGLGFYACYARTLYSKKIRSASVSATRSLCIQTLSVTPSRNLHYIEILNTEQQGLQLEMSSRSP